jgi:hypothetical protein
MPQPALVPQCAECASSRPEDSERSGQPPFLAGNALRLHCHLGLEQAAGVVFHANFEAKESGIIQFQETPALGESKKS